MLHTHISLSILQSLPDAFFCIKVIIRLIIIMKM